jgi:RNA polymerase-binding transcription factor DksA
LKEHLKAELQEAKEERAQLDKQLENKPDFGLGEGATLTYSWEMTLARREEVVARIEALKEALERAAAGTYGICEDCGNQIDPERLEILPATTLCTTCASQRSRSG